MTTGAAPRREAPSIMFYGRDASGLGQLKRTLTLSRYFQARWPTMSQLIVTGSPLPQQLQPSERVDYLKLPSLERVGPEQLAGRVLPITSEAAHGLYRDLLLSLARHYQPDALLLDSAEGEVVPMLRFLKDRFPSTRLILGLRDIVAEAPLVREIWARDGFYELLDDVFDRILVYGERDLYDVADEYGLSPGAADKIRYVGYLRRELGPRSVQQIRTELKLQTERLVLVTAGGGQDGYHLFDVVLEALRLQSGAGRFDTLVVGGPLLPDDQRQALRSRASALAGVRFLDSVDDLTSYVAAADLVVSMGGHSTTCEILSFARPAIIVPRAAPRREQLIRAEALRRRGLVHLIHPAELSPDRLLRELDDLLDRPAIIAPRPVSLDGLSATADELAALLAESAR